MRFGGLAQCRYLDARCVLWSMCDVVVVGGVWMVLKRSDATRDESSELASERIR